MVLKAGLSRDLSSPVVTLIHYGASPFAYSNNGSAYVVMGKQHQKIIFELFLSISGISFVLPHINNVLLLKASESYGTYLVIRALFCVKVTLGTLLFLAGETNLIILSVFLAW